MHQLRNKNANVILVGNFDLRPFALDKLIAKSIISLEEIRVVSTLAVIPNELVQFEFNDVKVTAQKNRLMAETSLSPFISIADLLTKTLRDNPECAWNISAFGINVHYEYQMDSAEERDALGRRLLPIESWGDWSKELSEADKLSPSDPGHPGLTSVTMRLPQTKDRPYGWVECRVASSDKLSEQLNVSISVNDHYAATFADKNPLSWTEMLDMLQSNFDRSTQKADAIVSSLVKRK